MAWTVERTPAADRDLALILDFLFDTACAFGEDDDAAMSRATSQLRAIRDAMRALGDAPRQGTHDLHLGPKLRHVTKGRAVFYFTLDERSETLRVLAIFHVGQDHHRRMLLRLLSPEG